MKNKKIKAVKAWAVECNKQVFLTAHWSFQGVVRQMKDIQVNSHNDGLKCSHKLIPVLITPLNNKPKKKKIR